jgi:hypothetical protein
MEVTIDYTIYIGFLLFPPPIKLTATIKRILLKMGYTEQNHVIKIDNALLQVGGFLGNSTNKTDHNDVTEILSLNTISITHTSNHMTVRYIRSRFFVGKLHTFK